MPAFGLRFRLLPGLCLFLCFLLLLFSGSMTNAQEQAPAPAPDAAPAPTLGEENANDADGSEIRRGVSSGRPLPRFVSLRASEVNMRTGPGTRYPIDWVYQRRDLPVEVVDEFDTWRRIQDSDGTIGWVHQSMLQGKRSVVITTKGVALRRDPQDDSRPVAALEQGVIAELESCGGAWCVIETEGYKGWIKRSEVFGVYSDEDLR